VTDGCGCGWVVFGVYMALGLPLILFWTIAEWICERFDRALGQWSDERWGPLTHWARRHNDEAWNRRTLLN